jgi:Putative prokaryotic signal transducing protein
MKRLHSAKDPLMIGHLKNVLATFGIKCIARNSDLISAAGELPPVECWPELWVVDDEKFARARAILRKTLAPLQSVKKPWHCTECGETVEGQFSECWNCGHDQHGGKSRQWVMPVSARRQRPS